MAFAAASVNVGLWQYDRTSDAIWATDHCRAMFGIPPGQGLTAESFLQAVHPDDRHAARLWRQSATRSRIPVVGEFRVIRKDGEVVWYLARGQARFDSKGDPLGISGTFSDITARKVAEAEADSQRRMLAHATRVTALGELSGAIAHEINQPLTAILSNAQAARRILARQPPDLAEVDDVLEEIIQQDRRAGGVIRRLRGMLRKGESRAESIGINDLVQPVIRLVHGELVSRGISVRTDLAQDLPMVAGDPVQLQQVLLNLVMNAMDAVTSPRALQRTIIIATRSPASGQVEVTVTDRGCGLAANHEERVFEPFYTTKEHGLGLGLTICTSIAAAHGGVLAISNCAEGGVRASLTLPALSVAAVAE
jgi:PAS domain S-box-containing protein